MQTFIRPMVGAVMLALLPAVALAQSTPAPTPGTSAPGAAAPAADTATTKETAGEADAARRPLAACRADIDKLCPGATKGDRRKCLNDNAAKLSAECTAARGELETRAKAMREACATDVKTHCASAGKGKGGDGIVQCLRANEAQLSAACGTAMKARYTKG
ncbi:MAG: hypothetical protein SFW09_16760 [Hyphomicrobiaceae bacterium]|nr:hypothetical protein [Hyphomicrobiaceae bacterium]